MTIRVIILSVFLFLSGCDMTVHYYTSTKLNDENMDFVSIKLLDKDKLSSIVAETVNKYHLIPVAIGQNERQPTFTYEYESLYGQFKMFAGFNTKDASLTNGRLSASLYEYKNYIVIETRTFGGFECAKMAKMINNELYDKLTEEYNNAQIVKWTRFNCPKGFFDK